MSGVDVPAAEPETEGLDYSANEAAALATPHPAIDQRVTLAASICCDTGRRIGAVRYLRAEDVILRDGRIHLRFWKSHDKGGKSSTVPVSNATAELILEQLETDRTKRWGWLFPGQRAAVPLGGTDSTGAGTWAKLLHDAEEVLGIPWVKGRAWHGLKRRHVTLSGEESGGDWALVGDVTGNTSPEVLRKAYRRQSESRKVEQVDRIRARLDRAENGGDAPEMRQARNVTTDAVP